MIDKTDLKEPSDQDTKEAIRKLAEYFSGFKKRSLITPLTVREGDFYSSVTRLSLLEGLEANQPILYLYDVIRYCRGCRDNCGRVYNTLRIVEPRDKEELDRILNASIVNPSKLIEDLVYKPKGKQVMNLDTWNEDYPETIRKSNIRIFANGWIPELNPSLEDTMEVIEKLRLEN